MDAKNIFISYEIYSAKMKWEDWLYIGLQKDLKLDLLSDIIHSVFKEQELYFITGRHHSRKLATNAALDEIVKHLGQDFALCNPSFNKAVEIKKIGVLRKGSRSDNGE